jgi:bifunctional oligoribonuclease and PAP phosphatase NrnA
LNNSPSSDPLAVPPERSQALREIAERLLRAQHVLLTTHVGADGDGAGSEVAVASWLEANGVKTTIVNPTRFPESLRFLVWREGLVADLGTAEGDRALREHDLALVLDTSEPNRVAPLVEHLDPARTLVVDHHPPGPSVVGEMALQDPSTAATGELVYDLVTVAGGEWTQEMALGVYVAIVSDTGSFRFSNTTPRVHAIAARMLGHGVEPESVFQKLFATAPRRRIELLREALATLDADTELGVTWMLVPHALGQRLGVAGDDFEGLIEHARSLEGTRVALLLREIEPGVTKISFRASGDTDVNRIARHFGGGGHAKAAGATIDAAPAEALRQVMEAVRSGLSS